jgi:hypothetical protein
MNLKNQILQLLFLAAWTLAKSSARKHGGNASLFLVGDVPSPKILTLLISRCERLLTIAKKIQGIKKAD